MAEFINNVGSNLNITSNVGDLTGKFGDALSNVPGIPSNFNIPKIPGVDDPLKSLQDKIPSKELADKAAQKFNELKDKFNNLKKQKVNLKKPKPFKIKELPVPKKFKKAELEKIKGLAGKVGSLKEQAMGITDKAKGALKNVQSQAQNAIGNVQGISSNLQSGINNTLNQISNLPKG